VGRALGRRGGGFHWFIALRVRIGDKPICRVPDVCVKALPYDRNGFVPDLAVEIVSPDDEPTEMLRKLADYAQAGIPHVWIVDPYKRTVLEAGKGMVRYPETMVLSTPVVGEVDFADLFARLDEPAR
jgi:Uma2 family endonuclease